MFGLSVLVLAWRWAKRPAKPNGVFVTILKIIIVVMWCAIGLVLAVAIGLPYLAVRAIRSKREYQPRHEPVTVPQTWRGYDRDLLE